MKKTFLLCFSVCTISYIFSQDNVSIYYGQTLATFKYSDSDGNSDPNMDSEFRACYGMNYSKVFRSGFFIRPEAGFENLGAVSDLFNQKLVWSLRYFNFNLGTGLIKRFGPVSAFVGIAPYISHLYKATETLGSDEYNLLTDKGIKQTDFGLNLFGGLRFQLSEANSIYVEARNMTGLMQLENSQSGKQELYNRAVSFHLGISFNIVNRNRMRMRSNF